MEVPEAVPASVKWRPGTSDTISIILPDIRAIIPPYAPLTMDPIASPCIGICTLDDDEYCLGCRRHIGEIAGWIRLSEDERRRILGELPGRRNATIIETQ